VRNAAALAVAILGSLLRAGGVAHAAPESEAANDPTAALMEAGKALMNEKRYLDAAEKFQAAASADPNNDLAWYQLASAHRKAERCDRAITEYKRYMDLVPTVPDPYYGLGLCLLKAGDKLGAVAALKHFAAVAPRSKYRTWIEHATSVVAEETEQPAAAGAGGLVDATAKAGAASPAAAAYAEAQLLRDRGHIEEAIVKFKQAIAADPRHSAARTALGELLLKIRRDDEAITVLRGAVEKNPNYSLAWYDLAFALRTRGQHAAAVDAYEHYIKLKPGDPDPYYGMGRSLQHLGRAADARRAFETYLSLEKRPSEQRWVESAQTQLKTLAAAR
jgi:tetratricopeptide (TPR) repeat protein